MLWEDNYLAHYGVKGQRWGLRRYQNEDGSLTPEGQRQRAEMYGYNRQHDFGRGIDAIKSVGSRIGGAIKKTVTPSNITKTKPRKGTKAQQKARKEKAKKIMIAAGAVTLAAVAAYGIHKHGKTKNAMILKNASNDIDLSSRRKQHKYLKSIKKNAKAAKRIIKDERKISKTDNKILKAQQNLEKIKQLQSKQTQQLSKATNRFDRSNADLLKRYGMR